LTYILPQTVYVYSFIQFFSGELRKTTLFRHNRRWGVSAVQGHPRSLILVPIESAGMTSY